MVVVDGQGVPAGVELAFAQMIVPYRKHIRNRRFEDKHQLRRYRKRWKIKPTNAWLQDRRRIQVRCDRILTVLRAFCHFAYPSSL
jgi:hypothetical protein